MPISLATINATDLISNAPAILNANFIALNNPVQYLAASSTADAFTKAVSKYVCTGAATGQTDDVILQEALVDISNAGGGLLELSAGAFKLYASLYLPSNVWIRGRGINVTSLVQMFAPDNNLDDEGLLYNENTTSGNSFITLSDFTVQNIAVVPTGNRPGIAATQFQGVSDVIIERVYSYNGAFDFAPLPAYFNTSNVHSTGNNNRTKIIGCTVNAGGEGVGFDQGTDLNVHGCHFINCFDSTISINSSGERINISGNILDKQGNTSPALGHLELTNDHAGDTNGIRDIILANNILLNTGFGNTSAIDCGNGLTNVVISGNEIRNINPSTSTAAAIYFDDYSGINSNVIISGNTIFSTTQDGILITSYRASNNFVVQNNNISGCGHSGIRLNDGGGSATLVNFDISHNNITGNTQYGLNIGANVTNGYLNLNNLNGNTSGSMNITGTGWNFAHWNGANLGINTASAAAPVDVYSQGAGTGFHVTNSGTVATTSPLVDLKTNNSSDTGGVLRVSGGANTSPVSLVQNTGARALQNGDVIALFKSTNSSDGTGAVVKIIVDGTAYALLASGPVGLGGQTAPTASLHMGAGSATVAPFKLTPGANLTSAADGAFEYDGTHLYFTIGSTRHTII